MYFVLEFRATPSRPLRFLLDKSDIAYAIPFAWHICRVTRVANIHNILIPHTQVVVNALIQAIPAIFNVLLVCLVFWLIFSIMGVNLFGGRFASCIFTSNLSLVPVDMVNNKTQCNELKAADMNITWQNPKINFDNVLIAYLALFQVVRIYDIILE